MRRWFAHRYSECYRSLWLAALVIGLRLGIDQTSLDNKGCTQHSSSKLDSAFGLHHFSTKLMADVSASKAQAEPSAAQESAPEAEQAAEPSALAKAYESMKAKHPDAILLYRCGDFYEAFGEDAKAVSEVLGIILTRRNAKDITAQMAGFPHHALDSYLPKLVRAGKRVAICDEPSAPQESAPKKKATRKSAKKESK